MADRFRFGEFEFDVASGELRKSGAGDAERLPPQPARLLELLVERSGALVTRGRTTTKRCLSGRRPCDKLNARLGAWLSW